MEAKFRLHLFLAAGAILLWLFIRGMVSLKRQTGGKPEHVVDRLLGKASLMVVSSAGESELSITPLHDYNKKVCGIAVVNWQFTEKTLGLAFFNQDGNPSAGGFVNITVYGSTPESYTPYPPLKFYLAEQDFLARLKQMLAKNPAKWA